MAYDPETGDIYSDGQPELPAGHYALRANEYDGGADPVQRAQTEAGEAAILLNTMPAEARTPEAIAEVQRLSYQARELASGANVELIFDR